MWWQPDCEWSTGNLPAGSPFLYVTWDNIDTNHDGIFEYLSGSCVPSKDYDPYAVDGNRDGQVDQWEDCPNKATTPKFSNPTREGNMQQTLQTLKAAPTRTT